jgi:hypothetical protein
MHACRCGVRDGKLYYSLQQVVEPMRIPHADSAIVSQEKIVGYLLNPLHPDGAGKAWFFDRLGFRADHWQVLAEAFQDMVAHTEVTDQVDSLHGAKYIVDGLIDTPVGKLAWVRTVWIIDAGEQTPRLVTAYPREQKA